MIARRTDCPVVVDPDRPRAVRELLNGNPIDVVVADDGLQHYALGRDLEIAVVDGMRGVGNGLCLPAGPLREPLSRLRECDWVVTNGATNGVMPEGNDDERPGEGDGERGNRRAAGSAVLRRSARGVR